MVDIKKQSNKYIIETVILVVLVNLHHEMLPSFFTGVSGFRFLGALLLITIWFLVVGREQIMTFIMVFFAYYLVTLIHHSIFFSRVSHRV